MNEQELHAIARQFEKAKNAGGPQALADWAIEHANGLISGNRKIEPLELILGRDELAALYPGIEPNDLYATAADDIRALRADRAKRAGTAGADQTAAAVVVLSESELLSTTSGETWGSEFVKLVRKLCNVDLDKDWVIGWFANAIEVGRTAGRLDRTIIRIVNGEPVEMTMLDIVDALRPFAALGSPLTLDTILAAASAQGFTWDGETVFTVVDLDGCVVARVTRAQCERARELIDQTDGAEGR